MKIARTLLTLSLAIPLGPLALAQDHDRGHDRDDAHGRPDQRNDRPGADRRAPARNMAVERRDDHDDRGAGPDHAFRRGGRLPSEYRNRQYVVDNWREHHLSAPPRGYHWVQTGADYVLVAVASGLIAQVLLGQ